jgi:glycosyltransferase involved in cell wall biosynthesis
MRWDGIPVHPVRRDTFGADALIGYLYRIQPDVVITLADVWWMSFLADPPVQQFLDMSGSRWVLYYPIDGAHVDGRLPAGWIRMLETADVPVAMSRFGVSVSAACGIDAAYVPHGCDIDVFAPPGNKEAAKARLGYEDRFVVLSDARNQPRKLLPRLLDIAADFARGRDDVVFHLHCDPDDDAATSELYLYRIREDVEALGLGDRIHFTPSFRMRPGRGLSDYELAALYQAADTHLLTSWGEGFGLPTLQAASAGVVPLAVAYSASRELVEGHGFAIPAESAVLDEFGVVRCFLSREGSVAALDTLYTQADELAERSARSREFALSYAWDRVVDLWEEVLAAAPPRRRPVRARTIAMVVGERAKPEAPLPQAVETATRAAVANLPDGATVSFQLTERQFGVVAAEIHRDAFSEGDLISIPARLPPFWEGAPRPRIGSLLVAPADIPVAGALKRVFPGIAVSLPTPEDAPESPQLLSLEELLPPLPHYALVIDVAGGCVPGLDVACAALGVPYVGRSQLWPPIPDETPFLRARRCLTDPGFSERRRQAAYEAAIAAYGTRPLDVIRSLSIAGQPAPRPEPTRAPVEPNVELFLIRPAPGFADDGAVVRLAEELGGLVLMRTPGAMIAALPSSAKDVLEASPLVAFVGGVMLDEEAEGAIALKKHFAENAIRRLQARRTTPVAAAGGR